ncbi:PGAP1-like protein-domain-containing protein [Fomitopsis serialis]|uniref:PGAP1-like protein-domain-containing protein n=1 Tax=Fomitopsis serialis TaxID=139415 RepID=UPI002007F5E5|nr:PGAP1-like protein-domain-containing protein [Neoantrodia serialis]KAH9912392.1 PGAP1-like protein-domain-containing protein [Neoantrodia serialis]
MGMRSHWQAIGFLGAYALLCVLIFYRAGLDIVKTLSPQGCRMSWMSPSYVLQAGLDHSWTPLASRYSLFLYREVGWEGPGELRGSPVLFIPGNAGSSHQVRSIASSATRQYFSSPYHVEAAFEHGPQRPVDFFALEFNEDLSAFDGHTLDAETAYARAAVDYILSLYEKPTSIILLGHSMGGTVAVSLLPHPNVSALITMSTAHTLPPARLDRRIDSILASNREILRDDSTPVLSLCGGATDLLVPAESCILPVPEADDGGSTFYRRTVFTSALEGAWTGVGHKEMVWCHQVRWRVARAVIELAAAAEHSTKVRGQVLDKWLRDGHAPPASFVDDGVGDHRDTIDLSALRPEEVHYSDALLLRRPTQSHTYLLPIPNTPTQSNSLFTLYLSRGSIAPISPHNPLPLRVSVYLCSSSTHTSCPRLSPTILKLVPEPVPDKPFPAPDEGSDESEGVVVFVANVPIGTSEQQSYVAVLIEDADGRGWVTAGFAGDEPIVKDVGMFGLIWAGSKLDFPASTLRTEVVFPKLLSSSLVVYRLKSSLRDAATCKDALMPPLLEHTSDHFETHYFSLLQSQPHQATLLHSHASGPFVSTPLHGFNLIVYTSNDQPCSVENLYISINWWGTLGRWGTRYAQAVIAWGVGIVALALHHAWGAGEGPRPVPNVAESLSYLATRWLPKMLVLSVAVSFIPLPTGMWLGNVGAPVFAGIAPLLLLVVVGLALSCGARRPTRSREIISARRNALVSMLFVFLLIVVFIPWQVAFLCAWIYHFYTCAAGAAVVRSASGKPKEHSIPLMSREESTIPPSPELASPRSSPSFSSFDALVSAYNTNRYILLLMTWLLPIAAPVLAVWVRTLAGSGLQAVWGAGSGWGWSSDRNVLVVAPWLVLVEWAGMGGTMFEPSLMLSPKHAMLVLALAAFFAGPRTPYFVLEVGSVMMVFVCAFGIGPRYWGRS